MRCRSALAVTLRLSRTTVNAENAETAEQIPLGVQAMRRLGDAVTLRSSPRHSTQRPLRPQTFVRSRDLRVCVVARRRRQPGSYNPASRLSASPKLIERHAHAIHDRQVQAAQLAIVVAGVEGSRGSAGLQRSAETAGESRPAASCCRASSPPTCSRATSGTVVEHGALAFGHGVELAWPDRRAGSDGSAKSARSRRTDRRARRNGALRAHRGTDSRATTDRGARSSEAMRVLSV